MECPNCRHFNQQGAQVCELCQRPIKGPAGPRPSVRLSHQCSECGVTNKMTATECSKCGAQITGRKLQLSTTRTSLREREITYYLICPPLLPHRLRDESRCLIGRSEKADVSLPGELVSRSHAVIVSREGVFFLEDLESANGSFHNGERVTTPVMLAHGDTISIGGFHIRFQVGQGHEVTNIEVLKELSDRPTQGIDLDADIAKTHARTSAFGGRLDEVPLSSTLRFIHENGRTGVMRVSGSQGEGTVNFEGGEIFAAECRIGPFPSHGREAILKLAALRGGSFAFDAGTSGHAREISDPTSMLLTEVEALEQN